MKDTFNPAFGKFNNRNVTIVGELERVANEIGRLMAQVAVNWVRRRCEVLVALVVQSAEPGNGDPVKRPSLPQCQYAKKRGRTINILPRLVSR